MLRISSVNNSSEWNSTTTSALNLGAQQDGASKQVHHLTVDARKRQVTLFEPSACGGGQAASHAPEDRRVSVAAPKMFAFDAIFTPEDSQMEVCSTALTDVIQAVISGNDGCLFCFGHAKLGKSYTMVGESTTLGGASPLLGIIPCAISWLFKAIDEQRHRTGARFSVRVSAVEVSSGANPALRDLLISYANDCEQSPGVYLRDDPVFGTQLQNQSELRVPTPDKAAFYLDAALALREAEASHDHLIFTLHVYQYSVAGKGGVAGGRSRLHLLDLGSCERGKANGGLSLSGLGNVLLAIFNGHKHLPFREHKVTQILKECLSSLTCHAAMIAHVSASQQNYTDTLGTIQLASRIHRLRRRKITRVGCGSAGSGGSSGEDGRAHTSSSDVDPSSSEQSADTVIYVGPAVDDATDGEHPPVYLPSLNSPDNRCAMSKALRGSSDEHRSPLANSSHRNRTTKISSNRGSPARQINKKIENFTLKTTSNSIVQNSSSSSLLPSGFVVSVTGSEEQWIDGPRISKSKVAEARKLVKDQHKKLETWIDGPLKSNPITVSNTAAITSASGSPSASYGYMDSHKKSMIRKWVENQTSQVVRASSSSLGMQIPRTNGPLHCQPPSTSFKEQNPFKTSENISNDLPPEDMAHYKSSTRVSENMILRPLEISLPCNISTANISENRDEDDEDNMMCMMPPPLSLLSHKDISLDSVEIRLRLMEERQMSLSCDYENEDDEEIELEIVEVEDLSEPVPTQDSCLQVTEEDIAQCMGENSLPEVDQESSEFDHPLRILSHENLTIISTFTGGSVQDSISIKSADVEIRTPRPYSLLYDDHSPKRKDAQQQLARLHELYKSKLAKTSVNRPNRCHSISLADMLYGGEEEGCGTTTTNKHTCSSVQNMVAAHSIHSEPHMMANYARDKFCENCKMCINRYLPQSPAYMPRICPKFTGNGRGCSLASLRHPDGASNPNLREELERIPGNGAEQEESVNLISNMIPDFAPSSSIGNRTPVIGGSKANSFQRKSFKIDDNPHDLLKYSRPNPLGTPPTSPRINGDLIAVSTKTMITQPCESSGYESVIHDSETSSLMTTSRTPQEIPEKDSTTITTGQGTPSCFCQ